ncbi:MAG: Hsp20 family protein [Bacilli bacterium]|nr:Hsp20 family protein [Bacilli bacterium]
MYNYPFKYRNQNVDEDLFTGCVSNSGIMRTDIIKNDDGYTLEIEVPGFKKEEISIEFEKDSLIVSAKKNEHDDTKYTHRERYLTSEYRTYYLGDNIDEDKINASLNDGILTINLVNKEASKLQKKQIAIN